MLPLRLRNSSNRYFGCSRDSKGASMNIPAVPKHNLTAIKWLTFLMFMMFAMTTDSVGTIIPEIIKEFHLSMVQPARSTMPRWSRSRLPEFLLDILPTSLAARTIILGLVLFALNSYLFAVGILCVFPHAAGCFGSLDRNLQDRCPALIGDISAPLRNTPPP